MDSLLFGTAGKPISTKGDTVEGVNNVRRLGLDCMELEFVHSINITKEKAPLVNEAVKKNNIMLSCHAPFYINLNSEDKKKYHASISYITKSAKITSLCGGWSICFHAGFYQKQDPEKVYQKIREGVKEIVKGVKEVDDKIWIRPEISGKKYQFGDLNELIKLSQDIDQVMPCVDFSHLYARTNGKNNTKQEFSQILEDIEKGLGKVALNNMHIHISGIEYGEKGEKHHLILKESKFNYRDLLKTLKEFKVKGVVICESPNIEKDALLMKKIYNKF
ncbi:MAG: TIM barrel protein [Candidatus Nanoarchaeia archaeon]|jgi:deoxyribonuclease-4|nr:TIM barrel protein [Candidatus Nanoarchaeia archaeon]|tara:strand:+ start:1773 stop:2600 length:828 start_codon:yes stop_codon:yes gene_type:complete